uniref:Putative carbon dioxide concentrating mechanism/carboxysome shell protein n=1 Tax=termite gut metagenome TaxID=433724 RepID=S0DDS7_9ZZZZ
MKVCKVIGNVWATKKDSSLEGIKLMIVQPEHGGGDDGRYVAADFVGAGIGETVLVVTGSTARLALQRQNIPVDAAIVGIVDAQEISWDEAAGFQGGKGK